MSLATETRLDAMSLLLNLEERVRLSGAMLPRTVDTRERWAGLRCSIAGMNCVLPLNDVAEVLENRTLTAIPGCAAWVKGVVNLRGRLLPVFGVDDYLGCTDTVAERSGGSYQVVVVDRGAVFCGLAVSRIMGMRKFYREHFLPPEGNGQQDPAVKDLHEFVEAVAVLDQSNWYQVSIEKLARRILQTSPKDQPQGQEK
jgi:twitching motility protein PilI